MGSGGKITIRQASLGYRKGRSILPVLSDINLDLLPGDFIGMVGMNGEGKSTLLKSICGLLPILEGVIELDGKLIKDFSLEDLSKKISIVLTEKLGGFNLTAYDVVAAGQMPYTDSFHRLQPENHKVIRESMDACNISEHQHKLVVELSDGLLQKTLIAKALAQKTGVMLLDEPSAFLDYASKHELFKLLGDLALKEGKCILVSSHDLDLVLRYCNKALVVSDGSAQLLPVHEVPFNEAFKRIAKGYI